MSLEIHCPACGRDALLLREPLYNGFTKTGESLTCSGCGHRFASEAEVPFKSGSTSPKIFTDDDRSEKVEVFDEKEAPVCRRCASYVVNPFTEWCSLHRKETTATDTCDQFKKAGEEPEKPPGI